MKFTNHQTKQLYHEISPRYKLLRKFIDTEVAECLKCDGDEAGTRLALSLDKQFKLSEIRTKIILLVREMRKKARF